MGLYVTSSSSGSNIASATTINNSFTTDMFGRNKISEAFTLFDSAHRYKDNGDYSDLISGGGTVAFDTNASAALLNIGTASGDEVSRESKRVFAYQPGKSLQIMQTFVFASPKTNLRQRVGYFSRKNGIYLEQDGTIINIVKRSYSTGTIVETKVPQSSWNADKLNGTGLSGLILDLTKAQILFTEIEWLGVGSVRVGFAINGQFVVAHQFNHANILDSTYMTTASLPVRYEITNTGTTSSSSSMKQICATVISNGGYTRETETWTAWKDTAVNAGTTRVPLVAIRLAPGREDSVILPAFVDVISTSAGVGGWALIKNPTTLTGGSWVTDTDSGGNIQYNITATAIDGGIPIRRSFFTTTNQSASSASVVGGLNRFDLQLGRTNSDTPVSDVLVLTFRTLSGTMNVQGMLGWYDLV